MTFNPTQGYRLHANVALRPEPFGALAYHYGNRKLVFLKSPRMVALVKSLADFVSVDDALVPLNLSVRARANYLGALTSLEQSDMIVIRSARTRPGTEAVTPPLSSQENIDATVG